MRTETLVAIRNNHYYYNYLRVNSSWYKLLNRDINNLKFMEVEIKDYYRLNFSDKLSDLNKKITIIKNFIDIMK